MKICISLGEGGGGVTPRDFQMLHYMLCFIGILVIVLLVVCDVIPWLIGFVRSYICTMLPNWPVIGGCL